METIAFLLVAGAVLILLEPIFPQLIAGSVGLVCWVVAVLLIYSRFGISAGNWSSVAVLTLFLTGAWWYFKKLPHTRLGRSVQSEHVTPTETAAKSHLLDTDGVALTPLRPGGMAQFGPERVDVVTSGEPLEKGQRVRVTNIEGSRILVRAV